LESSYVRFVGATQGVGARSAVDDVDVAGAVDRVGATGSQMRQHGAVVGDNIAGDCLIGPDRAVVEPDGRELRRRTGLSSDDDAAVNSAGTDQEG
jgi:hypothetical protein